MKGKKDITETKPKRPSRAARFYSPDSSFGKKSMVYQLRKAAQQGPNERPGRKSPAGNGKGNTLTPEQFMKDFKSNSGQGWSREQNTRTSNSFNRDRQGGAMRKPPSTSRFVRPSSQPMSADRRGAVDTRGSARPTRSEPLIRNDRVERQDSQFPRERQADQSDDQPKSYPSPSRDTGPVRVHHTTAASQFLYGHSVIEAALKDTRRKLYKLYLYCGENRQKISQTAGLETLADRCGVPITRVEDRDGLRMMDKMSDGRPHNGCVLEASPLPQLPLKALGAVSEDAANPGFSLELAHQSREEAQVNGAPTFIKTQLPLGRQPFVLLLDRILDPGNLGAILRSAAFLGVNAVAITKGSSATITSVALKASAGASEVLTLFSISSTVDFLTRSKESGWMVYAAVTDSRPERSRLLTLDRIEMYDPLSTQPTILVVGSEGEGLEKRVRRTADYQVSIPNHSGYSMVDSLNVSVASGILCSTFLKKQHRDSKFDKLLEPQEDAPRLW